MDSAELQAAVEEAEQDMEFRAEVARQLIPGERRPCVIGTTPYRIDLALYLYRNGKSAAVMESMSGLAAWQVKAVREMACYDREEAADDRENKRADLAFGLHCVFLQAGFPGPDPTPFRPARVRRKAVEGAFRAAGLEG